MSKPVILFVDDEPEILDIVSDIFRNGVAKVFCAHSGEEALQFANHHEVTLVMSDLILKDISGLEVLSHFKDNKPETYRILTTGFLDPCRERICQEMGIFQAMIPKPWDIGELRKTIESVIRNYEQDLNAKSQPERKKPL